MFPFTLFGRTFDRGMLTLILILLVALVLTFGNGWSQLLRALNLTPSLTVQDRRTIITGVRGMGELVTVSRKHVDADIRVDIRGGILEGCNQWASFAYVVEVQAGTDLSGLSVEDVTYDAEADRYRILLPPPKLTSCNAYDDYSRYSYAVPGFRGCESYEGDFSLLAEYQVIHTARETMLGEGILAEAEAENEQTLIDFFTAITGTDVVIAYAETEPQHDRSCHPPEPTGWVRQVDANGTVFWTRS